MLTRVGSATTPTNAPVFFRADIPAVQSAGKLSRPEGERETLEPERDRKVQGEEPVRKTRIPPAARNQSDKSNEVRTFQDTIPRVKAELRQQSENFKAGQIRFHLPQWQQLTIDKDVLKMVEGVDIDFTELPIQEKTPPSHQFSKEQTKAIDSEVTELLNKGVIKKTAHSKNEYISPVFVRQKKGQQMEDDLKSETTRQECRIPPFQNGNSKKCFGFGDPKLFFLLTRS